jgi:K+ transporter
MSATAKLGTTAHTPHEEKGRSLEWAALACMGVVFGDIGTRELALQIRTVR